MVDTGLQDTDAGSPTSCGVITIMRKYWANTSTSPRLAPGRGHGARARRAGFATDSVYIIIVKYYYFKIISYQKAIYF